ncbi:hypothetical protein J2Z44_004233 [Clostridium punense]|uniref:Uncharacterized protein n=1 Tax=Clostridium punense TaxID=1054297 RepID=A0ABS4K9B4_9CLOT|nr:MULTISPECIES: hypothetical protein [Clostridium]EQB85821.1 hypothetical protein M918_17450 [Clostridium sp. BL8]MBP2024365.1 hypothetical protein [Clostridium punense]
MKNKLSKVVFIIINFIWALTCLTQAVTIKEKYNLNFWIYYIVTIVALLTGQMLLKRIFMKVNKK